MIQLFALKKKRQHFKLALNFSLVPYPRDKYIDVSPNEDCVRSSIEKIIKFIIFLFENCTNDI
jgi:hypothetical protein